MEFFDRLLVVAEVFLAANEDDGEALAKVQHFRYPLCGCTHPSVSSSLCLLPDQSKWSLRTFSCTLSNESGESTAKQMRMT